VFFVFSEFFHCLSLKLRVKLWQKEKVEIYHAQYSRSRKKSFSFNASQAGLLPWLAAFNQGFNASRAGSVP